MAAALPGFAVHEIHSMLQAEVDWQVAVWRRDHRSQVVTSERYSYLVESAMRRCTGWLAEESLVLSPKHLCGYRPSALFFRGLPAVRLEKR